MTDDAQLVARCRAGEGGAWDELVLRYSRYVYAIATQGYRLRDQDAEDVFQDVFMRVYERLESLRDPAALRPWIGQLTRRRCLDAVSARVPEPVDEVEAMADDVLEEVEEAVAVNEALAELDEPCREILDRFFTRDESYRTISEALRIPAGTIASRISRCLTKLREQLEGRIEAHLASGGLVER